MVTDQAPQIPDWMWPAPPMVSGRFYAAPSYGSGVDTGSVIAAALYLIPFCNPRPITWATIAIEVTALAAGTCMLGYYDSDAKGMPGKLQKQFGTVSTGSNAVQSLTINEFVRQGLYWIAAGFDAAPTVRRVAGAINSYTPVQALNTSAVTNVALRSQNQSDFILALPANWSLLSGNASQNFVTPVVRVLIGI